jgi:hypothetical protein
MAATGNISIAGTMSIGRTNALREIALSQVIGEIETKDIEITLPAGGALTTIPLGLSPGVTEALVLIWNTPATVELTLASSEAVPGPMHIYVKGQSFLTLAPGGGIISISGSNPDPDDDVTIQITVGAQRNSTDDVPEFWA